MKQPRTVISRTIAARTLKQGASKRLSSEVAAYLLSEGRASELDSIMRDVQAERAQAGYVEVIAKSAHPLSESLKNEIARQIKKLYPDARQITVTPVLAPEIIGGVRLNLADRQLDLSIEAKLNKFKQLTTAGKD